MRRVVERSEGRLKPALFGVMQIKPRFNIVAIVPAKPFLGRLQVIAGFVPPAAFGKKGIPNMNLFFAWFPAALKTPIENLFVRSSLKSSGDQLIIINCQESCAAGIKESWIIHSDEIVGWQPSLSM